MINFFLINSILYRMSRKEQSNLSSKSKHYTLLERKVFLQLLNDYKHIIEIKKSDSTTLKDKDIAWNEIRNKYNQSALISQEQTLQMYRHIYRIRNIIYEVALFIDFK